MPRWGGFPHRRYGVSVRMHLDNALPHCLGAVGNGTPQEISKPNCVLWCAEGAVTKGQKAGMSTHGYR